MANFFDQFDGDSAGPLRVTVTPKREIPAVGRALLDTIAGSESPGYDVMYGGGKFQDFADHPRQPVPISSGPNAGKKSTAAGRYQFLGSTWDEVKNEAGLPDFSPESQDAGAWHLANKTYKAKTGRDLERDLTNAKGNPNAVAGIGKMLSGVWTSLPGGIEPNRATMSFAGRYDGAQQPSTDMSAQSRRPAPGGNFFDQFDPSPANAPQPASPPATDALPADAGGRFTDEPGQNFRTAREGQSPAVATKGEAAASGFLRGATFNFMDEINGLIEAGGLDPNDPAVKQRHAEGKPDPLAAAVALVKGAYLKATGDPDADAAYRAATSRERETSARQQEQQPGASVGGEILGALTSAPVAVGNAARGAGWGERAYQAAKGGAVFGGLSGAGEGTDAASRATKAATGGLIGGVTGAVASPVLDLAARGTGRAVQEAGRYLFPNVEQRSAQMVSNAAQSAQRIDPAGRTRLTPAEAAATPNSVVADITGEPGRAIQRWAANASPEAREILNGMVDPRFKGQAERITGWLDNTFNFPNATAQQEAIRAAAAPVNNARYAVAMRDGAGGVWDAELQRLAGAPAIQQAARDAIPSLSNRSITEGFRAPRQNPLTVGQDGRASLTALPNGNQIVPDLRFWDQVKKGLDAQIGKAEAQGNRAMVQELTALNESLVTNLDRMVPTYQEARAGAAHFFGAGSMLQAGQQFVTQNFANRDVRQQLARATPTERQLFQDGFVSRYIETLNKVGDRRDVLNKIAENPAAQEKLAMVLGPQRSRELEAMLRIEGVMDLPRQAVKGNSTTARQLVELGVAGSYGGVSAYQTDPQGIAQSLLLGAFVARGRNTDQRVARRVAEMLVSHDPRMFQRGLNLVARNQRFMDSIRSLDKRIASVSGQQGTGVPALQSMGIGRAEEDQPAIPRPPGQ